MKVESNNSKKKWKLIVTTQSRNASWLWQQKVEMKVNSNNSKSKWKLIVTTQKINKSWE